MISSGRDSEMRAIEIFIYFYIYFSYSPLIGTIISVSDVALRLIIFDTHIAISYYVGIDYIEVLAQNQ